jgi:hypothetical protein
MDGAGEASIGRGPRDRGLKSPIDLDRAGVPLESVKVCPQGGRERGLLEQLPVQLGGVDIGQDGVTRQDLLAANGAYAHGPAVPHDDLIDLFPTPELSAGAFEAGHQRRGERACASSRHREAHGLRQATHHPSEEAPACSLRTEICMKSVSCQEQGSTFSTEVLLC